MPRKGTRKGKRRKSPLRPSRPGRPPVKQQDTLTIAFSVVLRARRVSLRLSETQLASDSGVSLSMISELEHGQYSPTLKTVRRLAGPLQLRGSTLLRRAEDEEARALRRNGGKR